MNVRPHLGHCVEDSFLHPTTFLLVAWSERRTALENTFCHLLDFWKIIFRKRKNSPYMKSGFKIYMSEQGFSFRRSSPRFIVLGVWTLHVWTSQISLPSHRRQAGVFLGKFSCLCSHGSIWTLHGQNSNGLRPPIPGLPKMAFHKAFVLVKRW